MKFSKASGALPRTPLGGLQRPPDPQLEKGRAAHGLSCFARLTVVLLFTFFVLRPDQFLFRCYGPALAAGIVSSRRSVFAGGAKDDTTLEKKVTAVNHPRSDVERTDKESVKQASFEVIEPEVASVPDSKDANVPESASSGGGEMSTDESVVERDVGEKVDAEPPQSSLKNEGKECLPFWSFFSFMHHFD